MLMIVVRSKAVAENTMQTGEEREEAKVQAREVFTVVEDHEDDLEASGFDPQILCQERYGETENSSGDCLSLRMGELCRVAGPSRGYSLEAVVDQLNAPCVRVQETYPHVYNSLAVVSLKHANIKIAGCKVSLF